MRIKHWAIAACVFATTTAQAIEEDDDLIGLYDDTELISIATGTEKQIRFAPSVATVITRKEIEALGARSLDEALESVPGLHVSRSFNRQDSVYSFRGIHTGQNPQVLLLVDGIRVQQIFSGARPYNFELSTANIERIEVIRGPGSALYGADAFAGVISVTTRVNAGVEATEIGGRVGSFDTQEAWFAKREQWGGVQVDMALEYKNTDGDRDRTIDDDFQTSALAATLTEPSFAPGPLETGIEYWNGRIKFSKDEFYATAYSWNIVNAGLGSGGGQALDPVGTDQSELYGLDLGFDDLQLGEDVSYSLNFGAQIYDLDAEFRLLPPGATFDADGPFLPSPPTLYPDGVIGNPSIKETTFTLNNVFDITRIEGHSIRFGIGMDYIDLEAAEEKNFVPATPNVFRDVTGTADVFIEDDTREHYYAYIQDEFALANDWQATVGLRYDTYTEFGDSVNPRVALVWSTAHNLTTKFLWGRAFRAPSFGELFSANNPALVGNSDLDPEEIDTREIAFDYVMNESVGMRLSLFHYEIDELISVPFGSPTSNSLGQDGYGFEYEFDLQLHENFVLNGNFAWHTAEDTRTDKQVPNSPQRQAYLNGIWDISDTRTLSFVGNWVADRERASGDPRSDIDDYFVFDLVYRVDTAIDGLTMSVIARNLFDEDDAAEPSTPGNPLNIPEVPDDHPEEGQSFTLELRYQPNF